MVSTAAARGVRTRGGAPVPTEGGAVERELELFLLGLESAKGKRHADLAPRRHRISYLKRNRRGFGNSLRSFAQESCLLDVEVLMNKSEGARGA